ncbi:hypothetical protein ACIRO1_46390 [Streptomyces sp. NPDC102381]|uniref:hypothetical protein n=1 Tax=Streptomyces sp. NPDC102381 TaxID=3366164 RepID=UPI0038297A23
MGGLRRELLARTLIYHQAHAAKMLTTYIQYYNQHWPRRSRRQLSPGVTEPPARPPSLTSRPT